MKKMMKNAKFQRKIQHEATLAQVPQRSARLRRPAGDELGVRDGRVTESVRARTVTFCKLKPRRYRKAVNFGW